MQRNSKIQLKTGSFCVHLFEVERTLFRCISARIIICVVLAIYMKYIYKILVQLFSSHSLMHSKVFETARRNRIFLAKVSAKIT